MQSPLQLTPLENNKPNMKILLHISIRVKYNTHTLKIINRLLDIIWMI